MGTGLNSCSGEPAAPGFVARSPRGRPHDAVVSIRVLVNLRLRVRALGRPGVTQTMLAEVSIPVLVNLRLGEEKPQSPLLTGKCLNSCSGEPAARGPGSAPPIAARPIRLNSCSGEPAARGVKFTPSKLTVKVESQFLFW